ncbi:MAG: acetylornithine deacetylase [Pseudomonadota bacterium]
MDTLAILERLIGFDTTSAKSNLTLIAFAEDMLRSRGFSVHRLEDETGQKAGLYAQIGPAGDGILLSGHTDVVPALGQPWTRDPFRLISEGGRAYGRGTTDMKGFVASVLALADRAANAALTEPLKIVLSYDEEIGCVGIQEMRDWLAPLIGTPRLCIVGEPTEMQIAIGHKGKAALKATCNGQSGHSALAPQFVNALHMATDLVGALRDIQSDLKMTGAQDAAYSVPFSTVHIGKLTGGLALNIVPDHAELTFEYRNLAQDDADEIFARITRAAARIAARYKKQWPGSMIEIDRYNTYPGLALSDSDPAIAFAQKLARTNSTTKVAFGTEAGVFAELGVPTIVCGPGSMVDQGHKPDEFVTHAALAACDAMLARALAEISA